MEVTTLSRWQNQESTWKPTLVSTILADSGPSPGILSPFWFLLGPLSLPPWLSHSFSIYDRQWAFLLSSTYVSWLLVWPGSLSREWLSFWGSQSQCPGLMSTLLMFLVADLWWQQTTLLSLHFWPFEVGCFLANPGTLFISEDSTRCTEVRFGQINADVIFWGNK